MVQYTDEEYFNLADESYNNANLKVGKEIIIKNNSKVEKWITINSVNTPGGLQAIAVVPLSDYKKMQAGKISSYPNVVFASRGSQIDSKNEFLKDWELTDALELGIGPRPDQLPKNAVTGLAHQFIGMENFVNQTIQQYEIADYSFTGHSLGGALAQYMAVLKDKNATTFAAARAYRLLPPEDKKLVDSGYFNDKIKNFRHAGDPVGYLPGGEIIGSNYTAKSTSNFPGWSHTKDTFQGMFKNGSMQLSEDYKASVKNRIVDIEKNETSAYSDLETLKKKMQKSGGSLSKNEKIFLENSEALVAVRALSQKTSVVIERTIARYEKSIEDSKTLWSKTKRSAQEIGTDLSPSEVLDALETGGITKEFIVTTPTETYQDKIKELKSLTESFDSLAKKIEASINKLVETDSNLAGQLS